MSGMDLEYGLAQETERETSASCGGLLTSTIDVEREKRLGQDGAVLVGGAVSWASRARPLVWRGLAARKAPVRRLRDKNTVGCPYS